MGECISCKIKPREIRNCIDTDIIVREYYGPPQILSVENFPRNFPKKLIVNGRFYLKRFNCIHSSDKLLKMKTNAGECLICWKKINKNKIALRSCCKQNYHINCFFKWIEFRNICPICRGFLIVSKNNIYRNGYLSKKVSKVSYDTYSYKLFDFNNQELNINCIFEPEFEDNGFFDNEDDIEELELGNRDNDDDEVESYSEEFLRDNDDDDEVESYSEEFSEEELLEFVSVSEEKSYDDNLINEDDNLEYPSLPVLEKKLLRVNNINLPNSIGDMEFKTGLEVF